ncbi:hypothetical protein MFIFM68171_03872 [Madurella fahalii]|uniref:Heterokaryon incompatibility domain-containing protein n=1 Tax=Madurella fahalii TaxID=1157608 RepID=A0ABQ0G7C6_9PEZI
MLAQTLLERHIRRLGDAVFDRFRQARNDLSQTMPNEYHQRQCRGCGEICELLRWGEVQRRRDGAYQGRSPSRLVHHNYVELNLCAGVSGCDTCRTIRRAFLLEQITGHDAERLEHPKNQRPIHAALNLSPAGDSLSLAIGSPDDPLFSATVHLRSEPQLIPQDPTKGGARMRSDLAELRQIIEDCHHNHACSSKYRWSRRNPTWLLQILPGNHVRLVECPPVPVDYVVLSYSWGDPTTMPAAEWARIKGAATKTKNGRPVAERLNPFPMWDLPETMHDAISISASLGFFYIWIDSVCIPKGTNWDTEASLMHEVYGNAAFTLVASASTKATDHLVYDRSAWMHRSKACKLRGMWLHNTQLSLDRVRLASPVSQRAWTLQEERLSPRLLYWTGQRWYWSCPERQVSELDELACSAPTDCRAARSSPQQFLELCRTGDEHQLHEEWLDIVEAYTPRDLAEPKDRFLAIAGLAVRFYNAKAEGGGTLVTEEYLAGLWRDNFARHLSWSVATAVDSRVNLQHIAPSWSWASLPLRVQTRTKHHFRPSQHFKFIGVVSVDRPVTDSARASSERVKANHVNGGQVAEERGRAVKVVDVQGRFRRFISETAQGVAWDAVERASGNCPSFDFSAFPGQQIYVRNRADGRIVSKDAHSGEIVGQLEYLVPADEDQLRTCPTPYVREGHEKELMCLELGESAMLLLMPNRRWGHIESYRRVGVAIGYNNRKGFFYGCEIKRVRLA